MNTVQRLFGIASILLGTTISSYADSTDKSPSDSSSDKKVVAQVGVGDVGGQVVKASADSITLKVTEVVPQMGRSSGGGSQRHARMQLKPITKEYTYAVSSKVQISTVGKPSDKPTISDVSAGETVSIHLSKVREREADGKVIDEVLVTKIYLPAKAAATTTK